jgi:hypothetical protein
MITSAAERGKANFAEWNGCFDARRVIYGKEIVIP